MKCNLKAVLFYILNELNHDLICDFDIPDLSSIGILDFLGSICSIGTTTAICKNKLSRIGKSIGFSKVGSIPLYDLTTRTIYQFEAGSFMTSKHFSENDILMQNYVEVIIIYLEDLPDDIFQRYMKLKEYVYSN